MKIGITAGDPGGIGPELVRTVIEKHTAGSHNGTSLQLIGTDGREFIPREVTPQGAKAAWDALEEGVSALQRGEISALVTGPVSKINLHYIGFKWPGVTEFLADRCGVGDDFAMILSGGKLAVGLATIHVPIGTILDHLNVDSIVKAGRHLAEFLRLRATSPNHIPRMAVAGLNPHAGEAGRFGSEEREIISPAILRLQEIVGESVWITGPEPPDTVFYRAVHEDYCDGVLCMYHDQGLIPLKLHAFHEGVNVTMGLPVVRTSPDHGTAFSIAGTGQAKSCSMEAAVQMAIQLAKARNL